MPKVTESKFTIKGKSGNTHSFEIYSLDTTFNKIAGVYVFTNRSKQSDGTYSHSIIYCGITNDLSTRFNRHHKEADIKKQNANCICVMAVSDEKQRTSIEADILMCKDNKFPCNDLLNY